MAAKIIQRTIPVCAPMIWKKNIKFVCLEAQEATILEVGEGNWVHTITADGNFLWVLVLKEGFKAYYKSSFKLEGFHYTRIQKIAELLELGPPKETKGYNVVFFSKDKEIPLSLPMPNCFMISV